VSKGFKKAFFFWERRRLAGLLPGDGRINSPAGRQRSQEVENGDGRNGFESQSGLRTVYACANLAV
jgi:hypothetical protein